MLSMDEETKCLVPLDSDEAGPFYLSHWPACVLFCHGKVGPINKFLRQGGGTDRWLPVPQAHARPVIYAMMDTIAKAPASRDSKADASKPYDICNMGADVINQLQFSRTLKGLLGDESLAPALWASQWEGRNLLEHALMVRLFDVAEALWDAGMRFGKGNLADGLVFRDMACPSIAANIGIGLHCATKNIRIPKSNKDDDDGPEAGEIYCRHVETWLDRFASEGGIWPTGVQSFSYNSNNTPQNISGNLLCIPLALTPDIFTVEGQTPESWPRWIKDRWRSVWEGAARAYGGHHVINSSVKTLSGEFTNEISMGAWLRENGHDLLAAELEKKSMQAMTPNEIAGQRKPAARL